MVDVGAPEVAPGADAQAAERVIEDVLGAHAVVLPRPAADAQHELALVVDVDVGVVGGHVGQEVDGRARVERLVHPAVEEELRVVDAGKRDAALEEVRAAQRKDNRVRSSHAAAGEQRSVGATGELVHERAKLVGNVAIVGLDEVGALGLVAVGGGPGVLVHVAHAEELEHPGADVVVEGVDHPEVFPVGAGRVLRREHDHGVPALTVDDQVHVPVEVLAVAAHELALHSGSFRWGMYSHGTPRRFRARHALGGRSACETLARSICHVRDKNKPVLMLLIADTIYLQSIESKNNVAASMTAPLATEQTSTPSASSTAPPKSSGSAPPRRSPFL